MVLPKCYLKKLTEFPKRGYQISFGLAREIVLSYSFLRFCNLVEELALYLIF